jgi:hypothetical protein
VVGLLYDTAAKIELALGHVDAVRDQLLRARDAYDSVGLLKTPFTALRARVDAALADPNRLRQSGVLW